ncbi:MAG TPA: hypothetical protein VIJ93_07285 [bacterium]
MRYRRFWGGDLPGEGNEKSEKYEGLKLKEKTKLKAENNIGTTGEVVAWELVNCQLQREQSLSCVPVPS